MTASAPTVKAIRLLAGMIVVGFALLAPTTASAAWNPAGGLTGYWGSWLGSSDVVRCVQHSDFLQDAGPWVGRSSAYPYSTQVVWKQTRLERLVNGRYVFERFNDWVGYSTAPGQHVRFPQEQFMFLTLDGVYRISYDFRWYVNGRQVGSALTYHHDNEILINPMEGQRIVSNGCTMDV